MMDPVSIPEAARALKLSSARVRAMAASGQLEAEKLGDRWLLERSVVERRRRAGAVPGRRFSPPNAWALLVLASGEEAPHIDASVRSRLRRALALEGLELLAPRLGHRAEEARFRAHSGEIRHILRDPDLIHSGISGAGREFGLISGREADGYLRADRLRSFVKRHALEPSGADGNVRLRLVAKEAWPYLKDRRRAPNAAIALDLAEDADPRSAKAGRRALRTIDDEHRRRRSGSRDRPSR